MNKFIKISLIICSLILLVLLGINIKSYLSYNDENQKIIKNNDKYDTKIKENTIKNNNLNNELNNLKEEKSEQIKDYERWIKWKNEILEKMN